MATTSTASRTTKKASSTARSAARKTAGAARSTATTAKRATKTATKSAKRTARKSATAAKSRATATARAATRVATPKASPKKAAAKKTASKKTASKKTASTRSANRGPDALQLLIDDHRTVEALFKKFEGLGDRAHKARGDIAAKVIEELSVHAVIEEQAFYPAVREQAKKIEDDVLEALEEHHIVKWVLSELESMSPTDERFEAKFTVLAELVRHHVEEEESEMFPKVRRALTKAQLQDIGAKLAAAKESAPRRPHPRSPDTPPGNLIAGAIAAPLDAARAAGENAVESVRNFANRATGNNGN